MLLPSLITILEESFLLKLLKYTPGLRAETETDINTPSEEVSAQIKQQ